MKYRRGRIDNRKWTVTWCHHRKDGQTLVARGCSKIRRDGANIRVFGLGSVSNTLRILQARLGRCSLLGYEIGQLQIGLDPQVRRCISLENGLPIIVREMRTRNGEQTI